MGTPPRALFSKDPEEINYTFAMIFDVDNVPQQFEDFEVPHGASVYVRGLPANTLPAYIATRADFALSTVHRTAVTPTTQIPFPVARLNRIYALGKAGEGIQVQVIGAPR